MNSESIGKIIALAEKRFYLGVFAVGVVLLFAGIYPDLSAISWLSEKELLLISRFGVLLIIMSMVIWIKSNDYKAKAHALEVEIKKMELDNEIKAKQISLLEKIKRKPDFNE